MRAIWKGAVSFGLVNVPVRVFGAVREHDIRFHQVHRADGGRIRMRRNCSICGEEVPYDQLAKGYESPDGRTAVLTDEDFAELPVTTSREIGVLEFVPTEQVDPILFDRTYYLEPEARATKPYVLLREALEVTDRMAVVKVALRQRETLAVLRVRERVIVLQTLLWPDEIRPAEFDVLDADVELRPQELAMAQSLIESLSGDFEPDQYEDQYAKAVSRLVEAKLEGAPPVFSPQVEAGDTEIVDLLTALQRSVERARAARGDAPAADTAPAKATTQRTARKAPATKTPTAKTPAAKTPASKTTASKTVTGKTAKKAATKKTVPRRTA